MVVSEDHIHECHIMMSLKDKFTIACEEFFIDVDNKLKPSLVVITERADCDFHTYLAKAAKPIPEKQVLNMIA